MKDKLIMWDDVELLDYIGKIENKYIPCYDDFEYCDNYTIIHSVDESELEQLSEEERRLLETQPFSGTESKKIFAKRYSDNLIKRKNFYDTYYKELKSLVEKLELDVDKFWYLTLFILDYCESIYYQGTTFKATPLEQLSQLAEKILDCEEDDVKLTLKSGKIKLELDSPLALAALSMFIKNSIKELNHQQIKHLNRRESKEEADVISDSPIIVYFANMFLSFFDTQDQICSKRKEGVKHTKTEMELVSRLIYLMGLSNNKNWNDIECEYLKSFLKQYKNYRYPNNVSSVYPEFNF